MRRRTRESLDILDDEIREHIRRETEENVARGMTPDDAYAAARRAFGNALLMKEAARMVWVPAWWDRIVQDARYAVRLCIRAPRFAAVVVLTLALGMGLNTAVFSVVNAVLMRPLAYPNPERLVWVAPTDDRGHDDVVMSPDFEAWRDGAARVLLFALGACAATTLVFAIVPAMAVFRANVHETLKDGARSASASRRSVQIRSALVAIEVALTVVLLIGAGLMVKTFSQMTAYPPGFAPDRVLTMRVQFSGPRYRDPRNQRAFVDELLRRASAAPDVEAAGVGSNGGAMMLMSIEGEPDVPPEQRPRGVLRSASQGYASALGLRVVKGRWLTDQEPAAVFVINETLARQAFPGADPIGTRVRLPFMDASSRSAEVVGVVADLRYSRLGEAIQPELFIDYAHGRMAGTTLTLRTSTDPMAVAPSIRSLLSGIDRTQPPSDVKPLDAALADSVAPRRLTFVLLGTFAVLALLLVIVGLYGVVAYAVLQRTQEIGVRIALGATRRQVFAVVARQGIAIVLGGIGLGVLAALGTTQVMTAMLYEVMPTDAPTFAVAAGIVAATAAAACCGPAFKATLIDPIVALRCE